MKIYLIRHGETDCNRMGRIQGCYDCELNETGIAQAVELSKKVVCENYKFSRIYTSPLKRALHTAQIVSEAIRVDCVPMDNLKELNFGEWEGLTWDEVRAKYPTQYEEWYENRRDTKVPMGESYQDMLNRNLLAIQHILNTENENIAIVTHGAVIMSLQCCFTNTPFQKMKQFKTENTSILEFDREFIERELSKLYSEDN